MYWRTFNTGNFMKVSGDFWFLALVSVVGLLFSGMLVYLLFQPGGAEKIKKFASTPLGPWMDSEGSGGVLILMIIVLFFFFLCLTCFVAFGIFQAISLGFR